MIRAQHQCPNLGRYLTERGGNPSKKMLTKDSESQKKVTNSMQLFSHRLLDYIPQKRMK